MQSRTYSSGEGHHRPTIHPTADNERAILAYEAVGFRRVGLMRA
jgi:aminoglycoside 6'-N-acetyltransferase